MVAYSPDERDDGKPLGCINVSGGHAAEGGGRGGEPPPSSHCSQHLGPVGFNRLLMDYQSTSGVDLTVSCVPAADQ